MTTSNRPPNNIILCGFMGTGKTTVGQYLAATLRWPFVDTDRLIEQRQGKSISAIFAENGEPFFRQIESALCEEMIAWRRTVIATGGGIVLKAENRDALNRAGVVVCLEAPAHEIVERLVGKTDRPLLMGSNPEARVNELLAVRASAYAALPHHIDTAGRSSKKVARSVLVLWKHIQRAR
ncbi:MAG: shikimate kinase [Chloroflexota bacterium]